MTSSVNSPLSGERKLQAHHLERLAVVYVRQSSLQQVQHHQESTRLQYALVDHAKRLGWSNERVLVIDDDQGKSGSHAEHRAGFQRLVTEVSLNHVGLILGIEMSRLARSNRDWHHLLEVCALFQTLIADTDGMYDPTQYNDRLLLGLKGTMSEAELHVMRNRLFQGKLSKARRGELGGPMPIGYVRTVDGQVQFDPDEQVQHVVRLIFRKFEQFGTLNAVLQYLVRHDIQVGVRDRTRAAGGRLSWRRPNRMTLGNMLHHPIYAGAYAYGRRQVDKRRQDPKRPATGRVVRPVNEWHVLLRDHLPAYISWAQYQSNLERLESNRSLADTFGSARQGKGLLSGLIRCGKCGRRMAVGYQQGRSLYSCANFASNYGGTRCLQISGRVLEEWVSAQVLQALEPASLELSLETITHLEQERAELDCGWQQRLERAGFEAGRSKRQFDAVEPEHRLVVRQLERAWEEKLVEQHRLREEYEHFLHARPRQVTNAEIEAIRTLAQNVPALWHAPSTTPKDRKEILRLVLERVIVNVEGQSERLSVQLEWVGGSRTQAVLVRPVARLTQLSYYPVLVEQLGAWIKVGWRAVQVADAWNQAGLKPPKCNTLWTGAQVHAFAARLGFEFARRTDGHGMPRVRPARSGTWWSLRGLALELGMPVETLYAWTYKGELESRKTAVGRREVFADDAVLERLRARRAQSMGARLHAGWLARSQGDGVRLEVSSSWGGS